MELHQHVAWWQAPQLHRAGTMFLVKLLQPVPWRRDGYTARGWPRGKHYAVRVCHHYANSSHPDCGEVFEALGQDLIAVQFGHGHH
jgi:hypothetical protein